MVQRLLILLPGPTSFLEDLLCLYRRANPYGVIHDRIMYGAAFNALQSFISLGRLGPVSPRA